MTRPPTSRRPSPPSLARWLIRRVLPASHRAPVLAEIDAAFTRDTARLGRRRARLAYWREFLSGGPLQIRRESWRQTAAARIPSAAGHEPAETGPPSRAHPPWQRRRTGGIRAGRRALRPTLFGFRDDLAAAGRRLGRRPGATAALVGLAALGIVSAWLLTVIHQTLRPPLPYPDVDRLIVLRWEYGPARMAWASRRNVAEVGRRATRIDVAAATYSELVLQTPRAPRRLAAGAVTTGFFEILGRPPARGRSFTRAEVEGRRAAVILSHRAWADVFRADPAIVGRAVRLNGRPFQVVGVLPRGFVSPVAIFPEEVDLWVPLPFQHGDPAVHELAAPPGDPDVHDVVAVGRLRAGSEVAEARAELARIARDLVREHPDANRLGDEPLTLDLQGLQAATVTGFRARAAGGRILTACIGLLVVFNLGSVFVLTFAGRRQELGMRRSLGAGAFRLLLPGLLEGGLAGALGGALGGLLTVALTPGLAALAEKGMPWLADLTVGPTRLAGWVLVASFVGAGLAGVATAAAVGVAPGGALARPRARRTGRGAEGVVAVQLLTAVVLLASAVTVVQHLVRVDGTDPGFRARGVATVRVVPAARSARPADHRAVQRSLLAGVRGSRAVEAAAMASEPPFSRYDRLAMVAAAGAPPGPGGEVARLSGVSPGYFDVLGVPFLDGTDFGGDGHPPTSASTAAWSREASPLREKAGPAIVNRRLADLLWPGSRARGRTVRVAYRTDVRHVQVVGVVADFRTFRLSGTPGPALFLPLDDFPVAAVHLVLRTPIPARELPERLRTTLPLQAAAVALDAGADLRDETTISTRTDHFQTRLLLLLAAISMVLAAVGIRCSVTRSLHHRRRELGVRRLLGAGRASLVATATGRVALTTTSCVGVGLALAWAAVPQIARIVCGTPVRDATLLSLAAVLVASAAAWGAAAPAMQFLRTTTSRLLDPATAPRRR